MEIHYPSPIQFGPWSPEIPCQPTRTDPTTTRTETRGICLTAGEPEAKKVACWQAGKGWTVEDFAETPIDRMKGWLELTEKLLRSAAPEDSDEYCDPIRYWRAASDALAVVDKIASDNGVTWDEPLGKLYDSLRTKVREISAEFEDQTKDAQGKYTAFTVLTRRRDEVENLAEAAKLTHTLITPSAGKRIDTPQGVDITQLQTIAAAIYAGLKILAGAKVATIISGVLVVIAAVYVAVRIISEIINIVKGFF